MEFTKDGITYSFTISHYGEKRSLNETPEESEVFEIIKDVLVNAGYDIDRLSFVRKADQYVTAEYISSDLARLKISPRTAWIRFPYVGKGEKIKIDQPETVRDFADLIIESAEKCIESERYTIEHYKK